MNFTEIRPIRDPLTRRTMAEMAERCDILTGLCEEAIRSGTSLQITLSAGAVWLVAEKIK
jgi:hypothetical protein